ncbi:hypothetical protein [Rhodosalinus sediminis]|uniref:hypothetical protein n=1 Tax=Rhodosalinus sediminis TaxID=1940533 RepID=UPI0023531D58|nr:hypothetical protein [Rhodosalinus sediminis]
MSARAAKRAGALHLGYAALVDILLATMGIFVVVFAMQTLSDVRERVPAPVDGLVFCHGGAQGVRLLSMQAGQEVETRGSAGPDLADRIRRVWPDGGRIWVAVGRECALSDAMNAVRDAERDLRRLGDASAPYVLEIAPLPSGGEDALMSRWRADR